MRFAGAQKIVFFAAVSAWDTRSLQLHRARSALDCGRPISILKPYRDQEAIARALAKLRETRDLRPSPKVNIFLPCNCNAPLRRLAVGARETTSTTECAQGQAAQLIGLCLATCSLSEHPGKTRTLCHCASAQLRHGRQKS
jgi:hypothetical protein